MSQIENEEKIEIDISGMTCSACSSRIEKQIAKMNGVLKSNVNLTTNKGSFLVLKGIQDEKSIIQKIKNLGYDGKVNKSLELKNNEDSLKEKRFKLLFSRTIKTKGRGHENQVSFNF